MASEQFGGFNQKAVPPVEQKNNPSEQLTGYGQKLWERTKAVFDKLEMGKADAGIEKQAVEKINEIDIENENDRFLDLSLIHISEPTRPY